MKKLYKSRTNRRVFGVCGGVGEYFGVDPTLVRLLFLALSVALGSGLMVYIIAAIVMPNQPVGEFRSYYEQDDDDENDQDDPPTYHAGHA